MKNVCLPAHDMIGCAAYLLDLMDREIDLLGGESGYSAGGGLVVTWLERQ